VTPQCESTAAPELLAYPVEPEGLRMPVVPAQVRRSWMDRADFRHPYKCLPLGIANQAGWFVLNSHTLEVNWKGDDTRSGLVVRHLDGDPPYPAVSHFGYGILTFHIPFLFRTSRGYNLLVRGPANCPKDGVYALEGLVETDWSVATFLMNWRVTRANEWIRFERGEPICMLVPQRRGELERFSPEIRNLGSDADLKDDYDRFRRSRDDLTREVHTSRAGAPRNWWQLHYAHGAFPGGPLAPEHQGRLRLLPFVDRSSGAFPADGANVECVC
jgi:hypothetical protein